MAFDYMMGSDAMKGYMFGGAFASLFAIGMFVAFLVIVAFYVYFAYTWMTIARKLKYKYPWLAWIPFANLAMILQIGGFHWAWIFIAIIPVLGWIAIAVLLIIATWRIFERRNYPGWFALSMVLPKVGTILYLIAIGFVAYKDKGRAPQRQTTAKKTKKRR